MSSASDEAETRDTISLFYREWSAEGKELRHLAHGLVRIALISAFNTDRHRSILVPGAGLSRLPFELASLGYDVEANETSCSRLLASHFLLNDANTQSFQLRPWAFEFSNHSCREDQFREVIVPDILPALQSRPGLLLLNPHEFCSGYHLPEHDSVFDAVATVFALNTAPDIIAFARTVSHCLKKGGIWINVGSVQ